VENLKGNQWTQVQKVAPSKFNSRSKGKGSSKGLDAPTAGNALGEGSSALPIPESSKNPFEILSIPPEISEPMIEELEQQTLSPTIRKNNGKIHPDPLIGASSSPSYADIIKKKPPDLRRMSLLKDLQKEKGEKHLKKQEKKNLRGKKRKEANPPLKFPLEGILEQDLPREVPPT
jgi:hypothetical protein